MKTSSKLILFASVLAALGSSGRAATLDLSSPNSSTSYTVNTTWVDATSGATPATGPGASDNIVIDNAGINALVLTGPATGNVVVNSTTAQINNLTVSTAGSTIGYLFRRTSASGLTVNGLLTKDGTSSLKFGQAGDATMTLNLAGGMTISRGTVEFASNVAPTITGTISLATNAASGAPTWITNANHTFANAVSLSGLTNSGVAPNFKPATGTTLTLNGAMTQSSNTVAKDIVMSGAGTLALGGVNTYFGNTTVSSGTLNLLNGGETRFVIGANNVNNSIGGAGTLSADGMFRLDLTGANVTDGNSWSLVNVGTLTESFGTNFSILTTGGASFTEAANVWTYVNGLNTWTFTESTGVLGLSVVPEPTTWALLAGSLTVMVVFRRRRSC